jgi:quercetin dioxygenase-like cupin family protein
MADHYHYQTVDAKIDENADDHDIKYRKLIEEAAAPHFIMKYWEFPLNSSLTKSKRNYEQEIYILEGELFLTTEKGSEISLKRGDFLYLPPSLNYQLTASKISHFLQVIPKNTGKSGSDFPKSQDILHYHHSKISKKEVSMYGTTGTTIQVLIEKENAPRFIMRRFELEPDGNIGIHGHDWEHEMFMVQGSMALLDSEGNQEIINENEFIFMPPNEEHGYVNPGSQKAVFICMIPK